MPMSAPAEDIFFLFDVDNTLLDNDAVQEDLSAHLESEFGRPARDRYWALFETLRSELGYADYLGTLQRYRMEDPDDPNLLRMSAFLIDYPFPKRLYPGAMKALAHCLTIGPTAILSDGDVVFQPRKVARSGIWDAVEGRVLIYLHKEEMLQSVEQRYPAKHYVMVDDKLRILSAMKKAWGEKLTTVFVRQGHYALDLATISSYPPADHTIERIADLAGLKPTQFLETT
jgi:FMN phosphatase YigB (HAD superfamily)